MLSPPSPGTCIYDFMMSVRFRKGNCVEIEHRLLFAWGYCGGIEGKKWRKHTQIGRCHEVRQLKHRAHTRKGCSGDSGPQLSDFEWKRNDFVCLKGGKKETPHSVLAERRFRNSLFILAFLNLLPILTFGWDNSLPCG